MPLIQELIDKVRGAKYFTKLDIQWGYNNVRIREGDEWKAAFRTNRGLFEPLVMYFGMCNSPATFQLMMDTLFRELIMSGKIVIYMDDILIFSQTMDEHKSIVKQVLQILADNKLSLHLKKCKFHQTKIEYLGVILSQNSVETDPTKTKGVAQWPEPRDKREVRQFLGFCNFYCRFIPGFAQVARPLTELTGKKAWKWQEEERSTFNKLKNKMTNPPTLAIPHSKRKMRLETDASRYAIGGVLSQQQEDSSWRPAVYLSQAMNETERNYEIYDRELLVIMEGLKQWRQYLIGSNQFEIWTDHKNLGYFKKPQKLNRRQARWTTELQEYNFQLVHKPGSLQKKVDTLSRRPDHSQGKSDNKDQTVLKEEWFRSLTIQEGGFWKEIGKAEEFVKEEVRGAIERLEEG